MAETFIIADGYTVVHHRGQHRWMVHRDGHATQIMLDEAVTLGVDVVTGKVAGTVFYNLPGGRSFYPRLRARTLHVDVMPPPGYKLPPLARRTGLQQPAGWGDTAWRNYSEEPPFLHS